MELLLPILVLIPLFLIIIRQRKQQREQLQLRDSVQSGQRVMTTAGLFGTVTQVDGNTMTLEIAPGVEVKHLTAALARILPSTDDVEVGDTAPGTGQAVSDEPAAGDATPSGQVTQSDGPTEPSVIDLGKGSSAHQLGSNNHA